MQITRVNTYKNPDRVRRKVLLDSDRLKEKARGIFYRIEDANEHIDNKIDRACQIIDEWIG